MNGFEMNEAKISLYKQLNSGGVPKVRISSRSRLRQLFWDNPIAFLL